jgi:methyl-accepting chemotaxis protein
VAQQPNVDTSAEALRAKVENFAQKLSERAGGSGALVPAFIGDIVDAVGDVVNDVVNVAVDAANEVVNATVQAVNFVERGVQDVENVANEVERAIAHIAGIAHLATELVEIAELAGDIGGVIFEAEGAKKGAGEPSATAAELVRARRMVLTERRRSARSRITLQTQVARDRLLQLGAQARSEGRPTN